MAAADGTAPASPRSDANGVGVEPIDAAIVGFAVAVTADAADSDGPTFSRLSVVAGACRCCRGCEGCGCGSAPRSQRTTGFEVKDGSAVDHSLSCRPTVAIAVDGRPLDNGRRPADDLGREPATPPPPAAELNGTAWAAALKLSDTTDATSSALPSTRIRPLPGVALRVAALAVLGLDGDFDFDCCAADDAGGDEAVRGRRTDGGAGAAPVRRSATRAWPAVLGR